MKKHLLFAFSLCISCMCGAQSLNPYFYYYGDKKQYLELNTENVFVSLTSKNVVDENAALKTNALELKEEAPTGLARTAPKAWAKINLEKVQTTDYTQKINQLKDLEGVNYVAPYFTTSTGRSVGISNYFYVKLKKEADLEILRNYSLQKGVEIVEQDEYMPLWFQLSCEGSNLNAMECANLYYESGLFAYAEPDFVAAIHSTSAPMPENAESYIVSGSETIYSTQWGMENTGQYNGTAGYDVNIPASWEYTYFERMPTIAVVDEGVQLDHPAFLYKSSYSLDAETNTSPSQVRGNHGTACAGIIFSKQKTSTDLRGVFPYSILMSISHSFSSLTSSSGFARGINAAAANDADVISNSWGDDTPSQVITDAITKAATDGRFGLGCVIVFSSGNENLSSVSFPGGLENVITVGAINPKGERKSKTTSDGENWWGSNYGTGLDVVAPGVFISTTDRTGTNGYNPYRSTYSNNFSNYDYHRYFNGTSSSCPFVSGIAGMVLSANPTLTYQRVKEIIKSTTKKLPGYSFNSQLSLDTEQNPYEWKELKTSWNNQVGCGLVDANKAVLQATSDLPYIYQLEGQSRIVGGENIGGSITDSQSEVYYVGNFPKNILPIEWSVSSSDYEILPISFNDNHVVITTKNPNAEPALLSGEVKGWNKYKDVAPVTLYTIRKVIYPYGSSTQAYRAVQTPGNQTLRILKNQEETDKVRSISAVTINLYSNATCVRSERASSADNEIPLDVSGLSSGNYVLNVICGGKIVLSQTVMIKH